MKLSIIVPVYNRENYIESCLKTIIQIQSNKIEIIIFMSKKYMSNRLLCGLAFLFM